MSIKKLALIMFVFEVSCSVATHPSAPISRESIVQSAIADMVRHPGALRGAKIIEVEYRDSIYEHQKAYKPVGGPDGRGGWFFIKVGVYDNISAVVFYEIDEDCPVILSSEGMPNRFLELGDKLYIWGEGSGLNESLIERLREVQVLYEPSKDTLGIRLLSLPTDDYKKAVYYYFRKDKPSVRKRVESVVALDYLTPPRL